jgi:hypothetical protein
MRYESNVTQFLPITAPFTRISPGACGGDCLHIWGYVRVLNLALNPLVRYDRFRP